MQLHDIILAAFATKGYTLQSAISKKQLIKVITVLVVFYLFIKSKKQKNTHFSHQPINQAILNQIWKQTQVRLYQCDRLPQSIILEDIIQSFLDAIEILSNRITQCSNAADQMMAKRKQLENKKDYTRAEMIHHRMVTLSADLAQFQKELQSLIYPFNQNIGDLTTKLSLRKLSGQKSAVISKKSLQIQIPQQSKPSNNPPIKKGQHLQLDQYLKQNNNKQLDVETVDDAKGVTLWILSLLIIMQCTVVLLKYSFVNLMVFLLGFFVLFQQQFKPAMTKICFYSCLFSILMDCVWLLANSMNYINPSINSGLTIFNKKYQLYMWFLTVVQVFVKFIYLYLIKRYQFLEIVFSQHVQNQEMGHEEQQSFHSKNRQIVDHYIPDMKEFLNIQKPQSSKS